MATTRVELTLNRHGRRHWRALANIDPNDAAVLRECLDAAVFEVGPRGRRTDLSDGWVLAVYGVDRRDRRWGGPLARVGAWAPAAAVVIGTGVHHPDQEPDGGPCSRCSSGIRPRVPA